MNCTPHRASNNSIDHSTNRLLCTAVAAVSLFAAPLFAASSTAPATSEPAAAVSAAATQPITIADLYRRTVPSLVVVKYTFSRELGSEELTAGGVIVSSDGLVMIPITTVTPNVIADSQMRNFKIVVPSENSDPQELQAELVARDERSSVAFLRPITPQKWTAIQFVDRPASIGDTVYSVGLLPKVAGYRAHVTSATVSALLRGPVPQVLVDGNLAGAGGIVFNAQGEAIGYIFGSLGESILDLPGQGDQVPMISRPPKLFVPARDFLLSLNDVPTAGKTLALPWMGAMQLHGLEKDDAEYFDLTGVPAVQIGDVLAGGPADKAGLKQLDIITKVDGQPLQRGDDPSELPEILGRQLLRYKIGRKVTFTVVRPSADHPHGDKPIDITVTLEQRPLAFAQAHRYYARDLGFVVRDALFYDLYVRKLPPNSGGVSVAVLKPQAAAQNAKLQMNDLITQMNGKPVTDLDEFRTDYQAVRTAKPNDAVVLEVIHTDGKEETINIQSPQTDVVPGGDQPAQ